MRVWLENLETKDLKTLSLNRDITIQIRKQNNLIERTISMNAQKREIIYLLKLVVIATVLISSQPSPIWAIEDNDLILYIHPSEKVAPLEEYEKKYYWNKILALKARHEDEKKFRKEHQENIKNISKELCEKLVNELHWYDKNDYWSRKLIEHSVFSFLWDIGKPDCTLKNLSKYVSERLDVLRSFRRSLPRGYNKKWLLDENEIIRIRKHYNHLEEYWLDGLLVEYGNDGRNIFEEYGISEISQHEIMFPITDREKDHLDVEVGNVVKLALALKDLKKMDPHRPTKIWGLEEFSVRMFLERKGWSMKDIKSASDMSQDLDKDSFSLSYFSLFSHRKQWCWEKYQKKTIWGWLVWTFYGEWVD